MKITHYRKTTFRDEAGHTWGGMKLKIRGLESALKAAMLIVLLESIAIAILACELYKLHHP